MSKKILMSMAFVLFATPSFAMERAIDTDYILSSSSLGKSIADIDSPKTKNAADKKVQSAILLEEAERKNQSKGFFRSAATSFTSAVSKVVSWVKGWF